MGSSYLETKFNVTFFKTFLVFWERKVSECASASAGEQPRVFVPEACYNPYHCFCLLL